MEALGSFATARQPWITRRTYRYEVITAATMPVGLAMAEGAAIGVLADKVFGVGPLGFATILAAPMAANITSFLWASLGRGRPKVQLVVALQVTLMALVASVAVLPTTPTGAAVLIAMVLAMRCAIAGIVTLRSVVWRANYPRAVRARVTSKLQIIATLVLALSPMVYGLLDANPQRFRWIYPAVAAVGLIGAGFYTRVRLRGERALLAYERRPQARAVPKGEAGSVYEFDPADAGDADRPTAWTVLRKDGFFRAYMGCQFLAGACNMMGEVAVLKLLVDLTDGRPHEFRDAILLTTVVPLISVILSMPLWARLLDDRHVVSFRLRHGLTWIVTQPLNGICAVAVLQGWAPLWVFLLPRIGQGLMGGGGRLAWQLGHNDFADRRLVSLYMGIHVTLTGVRGAIFPYLGVLLLGGWSAVDWLGLPGWGGIGPGVFIITTAIGIAAWLGYCAMHLRLKRGVGRVAD